MQQQKPPALKIIWIALIISTTIYVVIAFLAVPKGEQVAFDDAIDNPVVMVMYGMSVLMFLLSLVMPRILAPRTEVPQANPDEAGTASSMRRRHSLIVAWALAESSAIFGLVASFITRSPQIILPSFILAIIAFVILFPAEERLS